MGDMGEVFNAMKKEGQERRGRNRDFGALELKRWGIPYTLLNGDAHIQIKNSTGNRWILDYWPGTGLFHFHIYGQNQYKTTRRGRGIRNVLKIFGAGYKYDKSQVQVGDRVKHRGTWGQVVDDRDNGMIDIAYDHAGVPVVTGLFSSYSCGGTALCVYREELEEF